MTPHEQRLSALQLRIRALRMQAADITEKAEEMDEHVLRHQVNRALVALEAAEHQTAVALGRAA